jgi:hypothetical protein
MATDELRFPGCRERTKKEEKEEAKKLGQDFEGSPKAVGWGSKWESFGVSLFWRRPLSISATAQCADPSGTLHLDADGGRVGE